MLGHVTGVRIGNQKLISLDSIALFGIIGVLAVIGAVLTHKYQTDEDKYLAGFTAGTVNINTVSYNDTCFQYSWEQYCDYTIDITFDCPDADVPLCNLMPPVDMAEASFEDWDGFHGAIAANKLEDLFNGTVSSITSPAYFNSADPNDYRIFDPPHCRKWCSADWMFRLCVAVAGLCVGFSGLVFLYLYLGCILERLYPRRRLQRLANLLLMQGEEAPKLDRINTASKSESIRPDLKEY